MKLEISNFLGGISDSDRIGRAGSYYVGTAVNPLNPNKFGYLANGPELTNVSNTPTQINSITIDGANGNAYLIEKETSSPYSKLQKLILTTQVLSSSGDWPHQISVTSPSTPIGEDVKIYPVGATNYCFYSYNGFTTTSGNVGRVGLTGALTFDDDFMSKEPTGADTLEDDVPHQMLEWGESGYLYIADGRFLHQFDGQTGANGTLTPQKLTLPKFWVITSLFDAGDYIGIAANYYPKSGWAWTNFRGRTAVFFWDGTSSTYNRRVDVSDIEIRASKAVNGNYYILGRNSLGEGTIRQWNGREFELVQIIRTNVARGSGSTKFTRFVRSYGNVDVYNNMLLINTELADQSELFLYGSPINGMPPALFNFTTAETISGGFAVATEGSWIYFSSYDSNVPKNYLTKVSMTGVGNADFLYKSLYYEFPNKIRINSVSLAHLGASGGAGHNVSLDIDYGAQSISLGDVASGDDGSNNVKVLSGKDTECNNFRVVIDVNQGAGLEYGKIVVDYDFVESDE